MRGKLAKRIRREVAEDFPDFPKDEYRWHRVTGQLINVGLKGIIRRVKDRLKQSRRN